jgi:hypothetical protein
MVKVPVVNRRDYTMYLELYSNMLWFHTDVFKWTPEVKKEYLKDLDVLQNLVTVPLVALVEETDKKLAKFGESTGCTNFNKLTLNDTKYDVYTRSKTWVR